jgi:hypothetical protein
MFSLDETFLVEVGLGAMAADERPIFLLHVHETLELRIGAELSKGLSDVQMRAFQRLVQNDSQIVLLEWLEEHCSTYPQVVAAEIEKLKKEIAENKALILGENI